MSKTRKSPVRRTPVRRRPGVDAAPSSDVVPSNPPTVRAGGGATLFESATQEILAVTYWFDPAPYSEPYPVTIRFSGHRVDVKGRVLSGDKFVQDETIEQVIPGSGPLSLTARIRGITPGEWVVTAHILESASSVRGAREQGSATSAAASPGPAARFWRRWVPSVESEEHLRTCPAPFARVPGTLPLIWGAMVTLGMAVALALQALVIASDHLALGPWWAVTLVAIAVGILGAKVWFIILHRRVHRIEGWCIQGFIASAPLTAVIMLAALRVPIGVFLDVTVPGLLVAMAVGRRPRPAGACGHPINTWGRAASPHNCWRRCSP